MNQYPSKFLLAILRLKDIVLVKMTLCMNFADHHIVRSLALFHDSVFVPRRLYEGLHDFYAHGDLPFK